MSLPGLGPDPLSPVLAPPAGAGAQAGDTIVAGPIDGPVVPGLPNFRDVGGHPTRDGRRVRRGLLYRSTDLARLDASGAAALASLGIRTVYDLRSEGERTLQPDRLPPGSVGVVVDIVADTTRETPGDFAVLFEDPAAAARALGGGRSERFFLDAYREFIFLPSARAGYGRLFADLASGATVPALFHCTTGKDRTGWAAAALLTFLGVPDDLVRAEYLLSGPFLAPMTAPIIDAFVARGGDPDLLLPLVGVRLEYLDSAFDEVERRFGSVEGWFAEGLGLDDAARAALRANLVEEA